MRFSWSSMCLAAVLLVLSGAAGASAQCEPEPDPPPHLRTVAREHYARGVEASTAARWMEAREAFERAYEVAAFAPVVYNLAAAQAQTGQLVEAAESYRQFLRRCQSEQTPDLRRDAQQLLAGVTPRIGRMTLTVDNFEPSADTLELDGAPLAVAVLGAEIPINPGRHVVRVLRAEQGEVATQQFEVGEGERQAVSIAAPEYVAPIGGDSTVSRGGGDGAVIAGVVVGVVLAVGAAVAIPLAVHFGSQGGEEPIQGTWEPARLPLVRF